MQALGTLTTITRHLCLRGRLLVSVQVMGYTPIGESARDLWLERSYFVGGFLGAVAYGAQYLPILKSVSIH